MTITARIDAITAIPQNMRGEVLPAPRSVKVELTSRCNYACSYCAKSIHDTPDCDMDRALFSRITREIRAAGTEEIGLFYIGESMLCKWLPEAVYEVKHEVGFPYVFLTTNGSAASPQKVQACMAAGLDSLKWSLNFATADQLASVANVSPHFWRQSVERLKEARRIRDANGYQCRIYASSIQLDGEQQKAMESLVAEVLPFVDEHYWLPLYGMSGASKANGWKPRPGNPGRLDALREPIPCWSVFTEGHVTVDGLLSACCFGNGAHDAMAMADLKVTPFLEGWNSLKYRALRRAHLSGDVSSTACAECAAG